MYNEDFIKRLTQLRIDKGVSARDMSLSIGQNSGYINNIECGKALPSMTVFFYICEYLNIEPKDFFDMSNPSPPRINEITEDLKHLDVKTLEHIAAIVKNLKR